MFPQCPRSEAFRAPLSLIKDLGAGKNTLTKAHLSDLRELENRFMDEDEWPDRCALLWADYPACEVTANYNTATNPGWKMAGQPNVTDANGCLLPASPVRLFAKYGDPDFDDVQGTLQNIMEGADKAALISYLDKGFR